MRLALAIVSITLAAILIGFGVAQRTILAGPDHLTAAVTTKTSATVSVIDGTTLNALDHSQTLQLSGADTIVAAYGRTADVMAWVGDAAYNQIGFDPETGSLTAKLVTGSETEVPDPAGSDLWLADYTEAKSLGFTINVPEDISVLVVSDGVAPAPTDLSVTWQLDNSTPWALPLVIAGSVLLLVGLIFILLTVNHIRRARGPRRKQPKLPRVPKKPTYKPVKRGATQPEAITRGRRSARMVAVPSALLVGALLLTGCTASTAGSGAASTLSPSAESTPPAEGTVNLEAPAVTVPQAKRILSRISTTVADADAANDVDLASQRLDGPALALRAANYTIRKVVADTAAPEPIPSGPIKITLPQQNDSWPRTVFVAIQDDSNDSVSSMALMLIQESPRDQYKVHYAISLEPGAVIPKVAPPNVGASSLSPDSKLLLVSPADVGVGYADILILDADSEWYDSFDATSDSLRESVGRAWKESRIAGTPATAQLSFANGVGEGQIITLATNDAGALVALELTESETIKPVETGAAVNAPADVAALLGKNLSTKGLTATYGDQLLFYVPALATGGKIILLGYSQGLISAAEL